jgi:hypothetical protein
MMFGIFNDEGLVEGDFYSQEEAQTAIKERYSEEDDLHVAECCHDHPEQERESCEECNSEDKEEEDE